MVATQPTQRLGPIHLAPGITRVNVATKLYGSFIAIAMLTGVSFLQAYLLTEHLGIPRSQQGAVSGDLSFWTEIVAIFLFGPFGVLADRIGRRPVFVFGITTIGIAYALFPFASSFSELLLYRMIFAIGMAATAGTVATLTNDYPQERSRGKLIALSAIAATLGTMLMAGVIGRIPDALSARGYDAVTGGQVMFLLAAALCVVTAVISRLGLKGGTPVAPRDRASTRKLLLSGLRAATNPRIALTYGANFAARSDLVIKGMFLALWAIQAGQVIGLSPGQSMAKYGVILIIMQITGLIATPFFGWFIDRVNRVTAAIVALTFASVGYISMALITSPLDMRMLPYLIVLTLGSTFMSKASLSLVGQEAPPRERASIIATMSMCGALGVLTFSVLGGRLFDAMGPWAPFVAVGSFQALLLLCAIGIRIFAPGDDVLGNAAGAPPPGNNNQRGN